MAIYRVCHHILISRAGFCGFQRSWRHRVRLLVGAIGRAQSERTEAPPWSLTIYRDWAAMACL